MTLVSERARHVSKVPRTVPKPKACAFILDTLRRSHYQLGPLEHARFERLIESVRRDAVL